MSRDESEISSIKKFDDSQSAITNRSWLIEKPKQKVSTYSKTCAEQWIGIGPPVKLDTVSVKKKPKPKARPAEAVSQVGTSLTMTFIHPTLLFFGAQKLPGNGL